MGQPLDIVLLVLDTQRVDRLSCYGCKQETSPYIDQFAADATLFRHAIAAAQWTVPSHSSMFTGLYPSAHTTVQSFSRLPPTIPTVAERLRDSGYYTAAFCNNPLVGVVNNGLRRGFLSFLNYSGLLTSHPNQAGRRASPLDHYRQWFKRRLADALNRIQDSFARSERLLDFSFTPFMVPIWQTALSFKGNTARSLRDAARLHIERRGVAPGQPLFSFINLMGTHMPFHPSSEATERFAPHVYNDPAARRYLRRFNSDVYGWLAPLAGEIDSHRKRIIDGMYNAEVYTQDVLVGRFLAQLQQRGVLDQTLVIIVADHGDHLGEKQMLGHSFALYRELTHVPLIIRDPRGNFTPGTTVDHPVSTRRLFHTILTVAEQATLNERRLTLAHSRASDPEQGVVFSEGFPPQNVVNLLQRKQPDVVARRRIDQVRRAVVDPQYKLIVTGDDVAHELFAHTSDPAEAHNRYAEQPEQAQVLRIRLERFAEAMGSASPAAERVEDDSDPVLARRLRDLGYIE